MGDKGKDQTPYYIWLAAVIVAAYFVMQEKSRNIERCIDRGISAKLCNDHYNP